MNGKGTQMIVRIGRKMPRTASVVSAVLFSIAFFTAFHSDTIFAISAGL